MNWGDSKNVDKMFDPPLRHVEKNVWPLWVLKCTFVQACWINVFEQKRKCFMSSQMHFCPSLLNKCLRTKNVSPLWVLKCTFVQACWINVFVHLSGVDVQFYVPHSGLRAGYTTNIAVRAGLTSNIRKCGWYFFGGAYVHLRGAYASSLIW